jgi:hypothetical protein
VALTKGKSQEYSGVEILMTEVEVKPAYVTLCFQILVKLSSDDY